MKLYMAGIDNGEMKWLAHYAGLRILSSYWYLRKVDEIPSYMDEVSIMDSGLFSLMFGAEKGTLPDTFQAYEDYTKRYIDDLERWGFKGFFVESDVHRLLGMDAVHRLRELYAPFGNRVIHVWHLPEGKAGLRKLAQEKDYIAISVPELRMLAGRDKGNSKLSTNITVPALLRVVREAAAEVGKPMPRVHLLGGVVKRLIETTQAYSADSTSWLYGVQCGKSYIFMPNDGLKQVSLRSQAFEEFVSRMRETHPELVRWCTKSDRTEKQRQYFLEAGATAVGYRMYQDWLDSHFDPILMKF